MTSHENALLWKQHSICFIISNENTKLSVVFLQDKDVAYTDNEFELRNQSFEQHVYNELSAIRDKLKVY